MSGAVVAKHTPPAGPFSVEIGWGEGVERAALTGILRAARHADAIVHVAVPAPTRSASPQAPRQVVEEILRAADGAHFDRPLVIVARAQPLPPGAPIDRLSDGLYRDLEAGFTSFGFSPAALSGDVDALVAITTPLIEQDLGLEVELDGSADAALVLARIDDAALTLTAVRGATAMDELGGAVLIVPESERRQAAGVPLRLTLDAPLRRVLRGVDPADTLRAEARAWNEAVAALERAGAAGGAGHLLDVLARQMEG
jgi:hypothetical protein